MAAIANMQRRHFDPNLHRRRPVQARLVARLAAIFAAAPGLHQFVKGVCGIDADPQAPEHVSKQAQHPIDRIDEITASIAGQIGREARGPTDIYARYLYEAQLYVELVP
ncbi:hypothetical protein FRC11_001245 [Ceratobasidium sp. 423]|nr:hypothetical protein FRC11_001245 [Ceratobasidium sp. 423]